jgi:hypothetical protein
MQRPSPTHWRAPSRRWKRSNSNPTDRRAARTVAHEMGRVAGYVETLVETLREHVDGRKLAGIERRLVSLTEDEAARETVDPPPPDSSRRSRRIERIAAAEGYFRALAEGLRVSLATTGGDTVATLVPNPDAR